MMRRLLVFGMLAGFFAGLLAFGFASITGEPQVDASIAIEEASAPPPAPGEHAEEEVVSRSTQKGLGLAVATAVYGIAIGGLFAIACAVAYGRIGTGGMRPTAAVVAVVGFVAVAVVPFLKYPANPPAVGNPDTIDRRTGLYVVMVLVAVLAALIAAQVGRLVSARLGTWNAALAAAAVFAVLVTVAAVVMPVINEVPASFPAELLWRFRLASLGTQAVLWATLGLVFGPLAHRVLSPAPAPARQAGTVARADETRASSQATAPSAG
ncbi:CbtA family protein [Frankia sp. Mgl5]|uniref:CbtA family protein n=1 Tax=Frankia sp. Mgl5 TaxID=2933793 RepID=UPI00200C7238|nr:CbtA family protein [Frankia sp. Mgl5]MCK9927773.1 CbtA family protein [Frankia sp. Mgl5]